MTSLLEQARTTSDPQARAKLVAQAGDVLMQDLPWIPIVAAQDGPGHEQQDHRGALVVLLHGRALGQRHRGQGLAAMLAFVLRRLAMLVVALLVSSFVIFAGAAAGAG